MLARKSTRNNEGFSFLWYVYMYGVMFPCLAVIDTLSKLGAMVLFFFNMLSRFACVNNRVVHAYSRRSRILFLFYQYLVRSALFEWKCKGTSSWASVACGRGMRQSVAGNALRTLYVPTICFFPLRGRKRERLERG